MACVVLVNPTNDFASFKTFEVLSLGYLASYLEAAGIQASIYDCNFEDPRPAAVADFCRTADAFAVGFTSMVGTLRRSFEIADAIRLALPDVPIICGGYSATFESETILQNCKAIDFIQRGEGERSFLKWLRGVIGGSVAPADIPGLAFRDSGAVRETPGPELVHDLDQLPFPRRSQYLDRIGLASILSSRGCAATCTFCSIQQFFRISSNGAIRCRSPKNVADEIELIHTTSGITRFLFIDDNFFMSERFQPGRLTAIAKEVIERGLTRVRFEVSSRAMDLKLPELDALVGAGLDRVYVGIESGSTAQLKRYRKGTPERNVWAVQELRKRRVGLDFGFIPFDPYLEPDEILDSLRFLLEHDLIEPGTLNTLTVTANLFPGTPLHTQARTDGLLHRTEDYHYWFDFHNREMAPIYERIIEYFKTSYLTAVVTTYSNGLRQRGYVGPGADLITPWLRRLFRLWIERVEAMLARQDTEPVNRRIRPMEGFIINALMVHIIRNRLEVDAPLSPARARGLAVVREDATELERLLRGDTIPAQWSELFAAEVRYRTARGGLVQSGSDWQRTLTFAPRCPLTVAVPQQHDTAMIDVFVPPDIDQIPSDVTRPAEMPPFTVYLGSSSGTPPIELQLLMDTGELLHVERLFKGWTEVVVPAPITSLCFTSHVHLFKPVQITGLTETVYRSQRAARPARARAFVDVGEATAFVPPC